MYFIETRFYSTINFISGPESPRRELYEKRFGVQNQSVQEWKLFPKDFVHLKSIREALLYFGSRKLMVVKMNKRGSAKKTHDSGELLSSADAPYKRWVFQRNASL